MNMVTTRFWSAFHIFFLILLGASLHAVDEVKILFSGYSTYHIQYSATFTPSGNSRILSEDLELLCNDGKGNETILEAGGTTLSGTKEVSISNPGADVTFIMRIKIIDDQGGIEYSDICSDYAHSNEVKGTPKFSSLIEGPDPSKLTVLDFGLGIEIPADINLIMKNVKAENTGSSWGETVWKTYFTLGSGAKLVMDNCEFLGFYAIGKEEGKGDVKATNCIFAGIAYETYCSMEWLASVEIEKCRFDGSCDLGGGWGSKKTNGALTINDSLFMCIYSSPYFNGTNFINVSNSEFYYNAAAATAQPGAPVTFSDCVFKSYLDIDNKIGPGAVNVKNCHFWDRTGITWSSYFTALSADSCYWGDSSKSGSLGWLGNSGATCEGWITFTNPLERSQAIERICSRTETRPAPRIWVTEKVIGQNILTPVPSPSSDAEYLMRKGRDTMLSFDVKTDTASLDGVKFYLEWNGEKIYPVNPSMIIRRDYGRYSINKETQETPDERTVNFIVPANKTYVDANTVVKFISDTTAVLDPGENRELLNFFVTFKPPFARKLRVGVVPVNIMALGYKHYIDAGKHGEMLSTVKNDLSQKWPLKPDDEIEIIRLPAYNFIGAVSSLSGSAFKIALTWELAATRRIANALVNSKPIDRIVAVVPAGSIVEKGLNPTDYPAISIVREDALFSAIHELGHSIGLYLDGKEQYDLPTGPDTEGNQIENDSGANVHGVTCFKPDEAAPRVTSFNRRYRHIPQGAYRIMYDFMGLEPSQWIVKSSLAKVYAGLETLLGVNPNPPKPIPTGYRRVFFSGVIQESTISTGSVLCRSSGELLNEISDGTQKLNVTMTAYDATGAVLSTGDCVFEGVLGVASENWPWLQTFDVKEEATRYELKDAAGKVIFNSEDPGVTITSTFTGPDPGVINSTVKLNFSATATKSGRLATKQENASSPVRHQLYCSYDGGTEWLPVSGTQLQDGEVEIQPESMQASSTISFKLVSANGFTQTEKILSGYSLDNHLPAVEIASPLNGNSAQTGTVWTLSASAFDIEDGEIANGIWTSSLDGSLGTGSLIEGVVLTDGTHTLTFSAKDSKGAEATKSITVKAGQASPDLVIDADALQFHIPGTDPMFGNPASPQIGKTNKISLFVHNQGITTQCSLKLYVTPPGGVEALLSEATFDWTPFADYKLQSEYTPVEQGTYVFRGLLEAKDFSDPDTSNNQRTWTFENTAPVARDIQTVLLEAGSSDILLDAEDEDGDALTFSITQKPGHGTATLDGDIVTYTPSTASGITSDTFKYKANDGTADSNEATVSIEFQFDVPATAQMFMAASPTTAGTTTPASGTTKTVNTNEAQNISANPGNDFIFSKWSSSGTATFADESSASTTVTLFGDSTVTANFEANQSTAQLTMAVSPAASGSTSPAQGTSIVINTGTPIAITATPVTGFTFVHWSANNANANFVDAQAENTSVSVTGNVTVTAIFTAGALDTDVTFGKIYNLKISEIQWVFVDETLATFARKPTVYAKYLVEDKIKKTTLNVTTKIVKDSPLAAVDCEWTGKIPLLDKKIWTADKTLTTAEILAANPLTPPAPIVCRVFVSGSDSSIPIVKVKDIDTGINLSLQSPEITSVNPTSAPFGENVKVVINGKMFGKSIPAVWLEYKNDKGEVKQLKLKVDKDSLAVNGLDAKGKPSAMDIVTGLSEITVFMPAKAPKNWQAGVHNIVIDNKVCRATIQFQTE